MFCPDCQAAIDSVPSFDAQKPENPEDVYYTYTSTRSTSSFRNSSSGACLVCSRLGNGSNGQKLPNATEYPSMDLSFIFYLEKPFRIDATQESEEPETTRKGWYWAELEATWVEPPHPSVASLPEYEYALARIRFSSKLFNFAFRDIKRYQSKLAMDPYDPMAVVHLWVKICTTSHEKCNQMPVDVSWSPTRLIKIGGNENEDPRLVVTENIGHLPYATLSHMWGDGQFLKLQRDNLVAFQERITLGELSPAFRYAISVCRELGLQYIWIDSFCIIQGEESLADWNVEAPKMHQVYSNCVCNIALLTEQAAMEEVALHPMRKEDLILADSEGVESQDDLSQYTMIESGYWEKEVEAQPLLSRGWVMQERLLAPRVLYLGDKELFWECRSAEKSTKYVFGIPPFPNTHDHFKALLPSQIDVESVATILPELWFDIMERYSACKLSHIGDKLVAIAGMAKKFHELGMGDYAAGLWQRDLESQLLWTSFCPIADKKLSAIAYRAPSFSWVAIDNAMVRPPGMHQFQKLRDVKVNILRIELERAGSIFGPVHGGFLQVRGKLKELKFIEEIEPDCLYNFSHGCREWIESSKYSINGVISTDIYDNGGMLVPSRMVVTMDRVNPETTTQKLYCLTILEHKSRPGDEDPITDNIVYGLLLEPTRVKPGEFRRVGVFTAIGRQYDQLFLGPHEWDASIPCEYDEAFGKHIITII